MSSAARPRSSASRPPLAAGAGASHISILTTARPNTLNKTATGPPSPSSRKRKRDDSRGNSLPTDHLLKVPIVLKPYPAKLTAKPYILHPLMLLPRENLPLSTLDLTQPHGDFPSSRFFESRIKILDLEGRLGSNVLLARSETNRTIYAIEREGDGLYVLCKLGVWADTEKLAQGATVVCSQRIKNQKPAKAEPSSSVVPLITPQMHKESKNRRLVIEEIQVKVRQRSVAERESQSRPTTPLTNTAASEGPTSQGLESAAGPVVEQTPEVEMKPAEPETQYQPPLNTGELLSPPTAEDIFQNIRTQYWEALYHSLGSLAYFAKGPLSRARAAFHLDCDSNLEMNDLIDFLRTLVMSTILIDKKYRESIPDIIGKVSAHIDDSDHGVPKPKKRKPKRPKLGKDGLYPLEDEHVRRWWTANKPAAVGDDEKTVTLSEMKYHISCLRRRETQLQMILILEILALEPLSRVVDAGEDSQLPGIETQLSSREDSQEPGSRKRNRINLPVLLDVHADRLCIWQTTMSDETKALAESQVLPDGEHTQKTERANADPLRDFCVDIIVPFFSARLPELCDSINRKLGGPVVQSQPKDKSTKSGSVSKPKPGAPAKRPVAAKKDKEKTLERVLSTERLRRSVSRGPSGALALLRSASATTIPGLKREGSEPLLAMIPREPGSLKEKSANVFSQAGGEDLKAKRKALLDAELKNAISALKKPNRALAVKELVEAAEKRASSGTFQLKKLKKSNRIPAVQVKATPANNRFRDMLSAGVESTPLGLDEVPSSSTVVPASTMPRKFANMITKSGIAATPNGVSIQSTPAKTSGMSTSAAHPPHSAESNILSSPIMTRKAPPLFASQHLGVPARFGADDGMYLPSSPGLAGLFETPLNIKSNRQALVDDTPIKSRLPTSDGLTKPEAILGGGASELAAAGVSKSTSIYERLGWDVGDFDDIDDGV